MRRLPTEGKVEQSEHEAATIKAFIDPTKRARLLAFLSNPKQRIKFTRDLAHFRWIDARFAHPVSWNPDPKSKLWERGVRGIDNIYLTLKSKGAGETCWVISENAALDCREMDLKKALEGVVGRGIGTILSCVPGRLAYFEDEDERLILAR
jgi:hypothetical protein